MPAQELRIFLLIGKVAALIVEDRIFSNSADVVIDQPEITVLCNK
jgi:hypothetical protein